MKEIEQNVFSLIFLAYILSFIGPFTSNAVIALVSVLQVDYNTTIDLIALSITIYLIPFSLIQFFSGAISDKMGYYKSLFLGLSVYFFSSVYIVLAPDIYNFIAARFLQGFGASFLSPISLAILGDFSRREHRGKIMSGYAVSATLGVSSGPLIAGYFALTNWRIFFVFVAIVSVIVLILMTLKKSWLGKDTRKAQNSVFVNLGIALRDRGLVIFGGLGFLIFFLRIAFYTYLSDTLTKFPYNMDPFVVGSYISVAGFAGLIASPVVGWMVDNIGKRITSFVGGLFLFMTFSMYFLIDWVAYLYILIMLMGFSITMMFITFSTIVVDINPKLRSTYSSVYNALRFLGYSLGPSLMLPVYHIYGFSGVLFSCVTMTFMVLLVLSTKFVSRYE